jgi:hypothetical protein
VYPFDDRYDNVAITDGIAGLVGLVPAGKVSKEIAVLSVFHIIST